MQPPIRNSRAKSRQERMPSSGIPLDSLVTPLAWGGPPIHASRPLQRATSHARHSGAWMLKPSRHHATQAVRAHRLAICSFFAMPHTPHTPAVGGSVWRVRHKRKKHGGWDICRSQNHKTKTDEKKFSRWHGIFRIVLLCAPIK